MIVKFYFILTAIFAAFTSMVLKKTLSVQLNMFAKNITMDQWPMIRTKKEGYQEKIDYNYIYNLKKIIYNF